MYVDERKIERHKMSVENKIKRKERKSTLYFPRQNMHGIMDVYMYTSYCLLSIIRAVESRLSRLVRD